MTIIRRALAPTSSSVGAQPVDPDLTTIAGLTATTDNFMQAKSSAWASRTPAQVAADLASPLSSSLQPLDADLTAIAALDSATAGALATDGAGWVRKTFAQLKTALTLSKSDVGLGSVDNTADSAKPVSTATQAELDGKQPLDADLTAIAAMSPTTDNVIQSVAGAWASRTPAQVKTALALGNIDNTSDANKPVSTATLTAIRLREDVLASGEGTLDRRWLSTTPNISSGTLRLTYFTAKTSFTSTQGRMYTGGTAAAATPTLCRWGLYTINGSGDGTLVASIANDTALFASTNTAYLRSWSASVGITAGQRYAWGVLVVSGAAVPSFQGCGNANGSYGTIAAIAPRIGSLISSQSDLPSSFTDASVSAAGSVLFAEILP